MILAPQNGPHYAPHWIKAPPFLAILILRQNPEFGWIDDMKRVVDSLS